MKTFAAAGLMAAALCFSAHNAYAVKLVSHVSVEIVDPLQMQTSSDLTLENISKPASGSYKVTVYPGGSVAGLESTASSEGSYVISGSSSNSVQIAVEEQTNGERGVSVSQIMAEYDGSAIDTGAPQAAPGSGTTLKLGAELEISSQAEAGLHTPSFTIALHYE